MFGEINIASSRKRIKSATRGCVSDAGVCQRRGGEAGKYGAEVRGGSRSDITKSKNLTNPAENV